jgi:hypothetical protein
MKRIEYGNVYFVNILTENVMMVNFPINNRIKTNLLSGLKKNEIEQLKTIFDELCNADLYPYDGVGGIIIMSMHYITKHTDVIIVNTAGLGNFSITYLIENLSIVAKSLNKLIIINDSNNYYKITDM